MDYVNQVMYNCMVFLTHEFNVFGFEFSLFEVGMLVAVFNICLNFILKMFGQEAIHYDDWSGRYLK